MVVGALGVGVTEGVGPLGVNDGVSDGIVGTVGVGVTEGVGPLGVTDGVTDGVGVGIVGVLLTGVVAAVVVTVCPKKN